MSDALPYMLRKNDKVSDLELNLEKTTRLLSQVAAIQCSQASEISQHRYELDELLGIIQEIGSKLVGALNRHESSLIDSQRLATSLELGENTRSHNLILQDKITNQSSKALQHLLAILVELNAKNVSQKFADDQLKATLQDISAETKAFEEEREKERILKQKLWEEKIEADKKGGRK